MRIESGDMIQPISKVYLEPSAVSIYIDYLRVTRPLLGRNREWQNVFRAVQIEEIQRGHISEKNIRLGTMRGLQQGRVAYLRSDTHECLQMSSDLADSWWYYIAGTSDVRARRIDLTVDMQFPDDKPYIAAHLRDAANEYWLQVLRAKGNKAPVLYSSLTGDTLYLGSRTSERYIRIYDKKRESGLKENIWRIEVEFKGDMAEVIYQALQTHPKEWGGIVESEVKRGLMAWGLDMRDLTISHPPVKRQQKKDDEVSRALIWLAKSVAPSIRRLSDAGYGFEVLAALGLTASEIEE